MEGSGKFHFSGSLGIKSAKSVVISKILLCECTFRRSAWLLEGQGKFIFSYRSLQGSHRTPWDRTGFSRWRRSSGPRAAGANLWLSFFPRHAQAYYAVSPAGRSVSLSSAYEFVMEIKWVEVLWQQRFLSSVLAKLFACQCIRWDSYAKLHNSDVTLSQWLNY